VEGKGEKVFLEGYQGGKEVFLRAPKVRDIRAVSHHKTQEDKEIYLISNLTGITLDELDELYFKDYQELQQKLQSFLS
jgi:hypothetical protein